jgi:hypothetical protein
MQIVAKTNENYATTCSIWQLLCEDELKARSMQCEYIYGFTEIPHDPQI